MVLAIVAGVYLYFDRRFTTNTRVRLGRDLKRLCSTVSVTSANYIRNQRSDVEFDELANRSAREVTDCENW